MAWTRDFSTTKNFKTSKVDAENGILYNVLIAQQGLNKNGSLFDRKFLKNLVELGNASQQGVKSRFGHPNMCSESLGTYLGRYNNFSLKNKAVYADLHLDEITKKTQVQGAGISQWEYITTMAKSNPDMFGNSIVVGYDEMETKTITNDTGDEIEVDYFTPISLPSSDLVDDPAATDALFSSDNLGVRISDFLDGISEDQRKGLFSTIQSNQKVKEFINRYQNNMGLFDKLLGEKEKPKEGVAPTFEFSQEKYDNLVQANKELLEKNEALEGKVSEFETKFSQEALFDALKPKLSVLFDKMGVEIDARLDEFAKAFKSEFKELPKLSKEGDFEKDNDGSDSLFGGVTIKKEGK